MVGRAGMGTKPPAFPGSSSPIELGHPCRLEGPWQAGRPSTQPHPRKKLLPKFSHVHLASKHDSLTLFSLECSALGSRVPSLSSGA